MSECQNCRGLSWLRFDQPGGGATNAPCWECESGKQLMGLGPQFWEASLADNAQVGVRLKAWDGRLPGWYLHGETGVGKTHLAAAVCRDQASKGRTPRLLSSARLLRLIKATFDRESRPEAAAALESLSEARLVVLDDLGAEHNTGWAEAELTLWVDGFYERGAALIVTSNLRYEGLADRLGMRIASRIIGMTRPLHLTGGDRRMVRAT
jgi:DNA replication protein DnaC